MSFVTDRPKASGVVVEKALQSIVMKTQKG